MESRFQHNAFGESGETVWAHSDRNRLFALFPPTFKESLALTDEMF